MASLLSNFELQLADCIYIFGQSAKRSWIARRGERKGVFHEAPLFFWIQYPTIAFETAIIEVPVEFCFNDLLQAFANGPNSSLVAATNGELTSEGL
jgi:hypothetical protein